MAKYILLIVLLLASADLARAQPPVASRDCPDCPPMVSLPGGTFVMGVPEGEEESEGMPADVRGRSRPQTRVVIAPGLGFGAHAVTRAEYAAFIAATGRADGTSCYTFVNDGRSYVFVEQQGLTWRDPGFAQGDDHPVVCVSWEDAAAYAAWIAARTGLRYRLPSEAEWEYAARAGTQTSRYWGNTRDNACQFANVADLTLAEAMNLDRGPQFIFRCRDGFVFTAPVGRFRPNAFGLHDMLGNVWQWTADCVNATLAGQLSDGSARMDGDCSSRALRGGSWSHLPWYLRAGNRVRGAATARFTFVGIRLVRER